MNPAGESSFRIEPLFLGTTRGGLLLTTFRPAGPDAPWVLIVPPFAEEMNKSRRMMARLAARLATAGHAVVLPDLSGTGDSWGDFAEATCEGWIEDLHDTQRWIEARGQRLTGLVGLRGGALLAAGLLAKAADVRTLAFWQPALTGRDVLTPFLRLRVAAALTARDGGEPPSLAGLRDRLEAGQSVEVAGYELSPALYRGLSARRLDAPLPSSVTLHWCHVTAADMPALPATAQAAVDTLAAGGATVHTHLVRGDAFWNTVEISVCEPLLALTAAAFGERP